MLAVEPAAKGPLLDVAKFARIQSAIDRFATELHCLMTANASNNSLSNNAPEFPSRWQFSLRSLFKATIWIAVVLVLWKLLWPMSFIVVAIFTLPVLLKRRGGRDLAAMKSVAAYLVFSIVTLPFLNSLWLGEIPLSALPQCPKADLYHALRSFIVSDVMQPLGLSRGSISPDLIASKPYALALTYVLPLGALFAVIAWRTRMAKPYRYWAAALVVLAVIDFFMVRGYASGPGLTVY
jgi:hypothetical protein